MMYGLWSPMTFINDQQQLTSKEFLLKPTHKHIHLHSLSCSLKWWWSVIGSNNEVTFSQYRQASELIRSHMQQKRYWGENMSHIQKRTKLYWAFKARNLSVGWGNHWVTGIDQEAPADKITINLSDGDSHFCKDTKYQFNNLKRGISGLHKPNYLWINNNSYP